MSRRTLASLVVLSLTTVQLFGCFSSGESAALREAEELASEQKYDEAIAAYHEHIHERLEMTERPEWENPYFYLLMIGDIELSRGATQQALLDYEEAERQGISLSLVADRYRAVAAWYEERGALKEALEVLNKYHDRDSLIFDSMRDRIARELSRQESAGK